MGIQETVVELFQDQRIDKAVAYRLLADCKKATQASERLISATPFERHRCLFPADRMNADLQIITSWCYFLHILTGLEELEFDYLQGSHPEPIRISLNVSPQVSAEQLQRAVEAEINRQVPVGLIISPYAWFETESASQSPEFGAHKRAISAIRIHPETDDVVIELCARSEEHGATASEEWPETLFHFYASMRDAPAKKLLELDWLPPRHRRLLTNFNATHAYQPPAQTLPELLHPALQNDSQTAIFSTEENINYRQYRQRAYRLANLLRSHGVQRNERIAVMLHRTVEMPPALYGIICSGAAYVPIEPDMPADRVQTIIRDIGARLLLTDADTLHADTVDFVACGIERIVCVDSWARRRHTKLVVDDLGVLENCDTSPPSIVNQPSDICYVIYTSGSTGKPKGVVISHGALVNSLIGVNNTFGIHAKDRIVCFSSYGFDVSVWDMFGAALAGASVILPSQQEKGDAEQVVRLMRACGATVWDSAPTGMSQLLLAVAEKEVEPLTTMRLVMLGGEFIQRHLPTDILHVFPNSQLANLGGATEATVFSNFYYPVKKFEAHWKSIPYGTPLGNQRFYVLNDAYKHCAVGEKGMLYIAGNSLALGYLGDPEKTEQAFMTIVNPDGVAERMYRTGDLGILHAHGYLEICGRADRQVKLRGYRIELGEVEAQMLALPEIDQAAVVAQRDSSNQMRLIGFYVSRNGEIPASELRTKLSEKLPDYMIPSQFVFLADPPINASGKLDRTVLEKRDIERNEVGQDYVKPQSALEHELAQELARMLRLDRVGVDDDFFLIGGDSLITLQYLSVLSRLGFSASPNDIQQGRSIRGVLARVRAHVAEDQSGTQALVPFSPMSRKFMERLPLKNRDHWHQLMMMGFDHMPDVKRLQRAFQVVHNHHPLLRASWTDQGLRVAAKSEVELKLIDLSSVPFFLRTGRLQTQVALLRRQVFLHSERLADAIVVRMGKNDYRLLWVLHHLVVDANCWRILLDDLAAAYRNPHVELLRTASMSDYVKMVANNVAEASEQWRVQPPIRRMEIPRLGAVGDPPETGMEADASTLRFIFPKDETQALFTAIQANRSMTLNLVLLTALSMALRDWRNHHEIGFDVISNGRSADPSHDYSRTIGWFATHNPFFVNASGSSLQVLEEVRAAWGRYQDHSRFFVEVCNEVKGRSDHPLGAHRDQPLLFSFLGDFDSLNLPDGWQVMGSIGQNRAVENPRTHELDFEALVANGHLMIRLVYPTTVLRRGTARKLLRHFRRALMQLIGALGTNASKVISPSLSSSIKDLHEPTI